MRRFAGVGAANGRRGAVNAARSAAASIAVALGAWSCVEIGTEPTRPAAVELSPFPSPSIVVGDSLRDVNGKLEKKSVNVTLSERPSTLADTRDWEGPAKPAPKTADPRGNALHLGITLAELTPQLMTEKRLTNVQGLYVKDIDPNGLMAELRLPPSGAPAVLEGDVINHINRTPVTTLADFTRVMNGLKPGDPVVLNLTRTDPRINRQVPLIIQFTYQ